MIGIYKITNPNGKVYIGQSIDLERRLYYYKNLKQSNSQILLNRSFLKYGTVNHTFEIIEECEIELLNETHYLKEIIVYDSNFDVTIIE